MRIGGPAAFVQEVPADLGARAAHILHPDLRRRACGSWVAGHGKTPISSRSSWHGW